VHLGHPVAQAVHDELQRVRVADVERVAGARVVHVVLGAVVDVAVVGLVVDAAHRQRGAEVVALRRVVVDHVEDDLDAGVVQRAHHALELLHLLAELAVGGVAGVRGEEADGVVAPVVREALVGQGRVVDELVHRHQLDGGDSELLEVFDHQRMGDSAVAAALVFGDSRVQLREALHVGLVDEGVGVGRARVAVACPVEVGVDDHAEHGVLGRVLVVARERVAEVVGEHARTPLDDAGRGLRVRVEQQLVRVAPLAVHGVVLAVHPVAVALAGLHLRQVAVPDEGVDLGQLETGLVPVVVEEAQFDLVSGFAEHSEVGSVSVISRTERVGRSGPDSHLSPY